MSRAVYEFLQNLTLFDSRVSGLNFPMTKRRAEISNDTDGYKALMIIGNKSAGLGRRVGVLDRLDVFGELIQHAPMIECKGKGDWEGNKDHPLQKYFREKLAGQAPGTMLCAMADFWASVPHYWIGCVCADKKAYLTVLRMKDFLANSIAL